jgi:hypothetical protein
MLRRLLALLAITIGMIVTVAAMSTTTVGAASFAYDGPTSARVDVHSATVVGAPLPLVTVSAEWTASTSVESQGPSTTPLARSAATNSLATGSDEAVFWSEIRGGDSAAASWAAKNGGAKTS